MNIIKYEKKEFISFIRSLSVEYKENGNYGLARTYLSAAKSFSDFLDNRDIIISQIDAATVCSYSHWLVQRGVVRNTISFYMRILRAAYNKAVALGYSRQQEPFKQVYTGVDKTQKRAVDESIIQRLCLLDLSSKQHLAFTRDIFMF
ncbi:MAG: phage integrase SAM-like domain-containing protein, partial [Prevotella sp.]|nr:phage integrase SAM-like domain-containing protein [Prevotella sp.]